MLILLFNLSFIFSNYNFLLQGSSDFLKFDNYVDNKTYKGSELNEILSDIKKMNIIIFPKRIANKKISLDEKKQTLKLVPKNDKTGLNIKIDDNNDLYINNFLICNNQSLKKLVANTDPDEDCDMIKFNLVYKNKFFKIQEYDSKKTHKNLRCLTYNLSNDNLKFSKCTDSDNQYFDIIDNLDDIDNEYEPELDYSYNSESLINNKNNFEKKDIIDLLQ